MNGTLYRALAVLSVLGCGLIALIGVQPPNQQNLWTVSAAFVLTAVVWIAYERKHFRGPPEAVLERIEASLSHPPTSAGSER
jgi:hypothetical protein